MYENINTRFKNEDHVSDYHGGYDCGTVLCGEIHFGFLWLRHERLWAIPCFLRLFGADASCVKKKLKAIMREKKQV